MSQYLTPERLLALAGLPITESAVRKLSESAKSIKESPLGAPIRVWSNECELVITLTDAPADYTPEMMWDMLNAQLTPEQQEYMDGGDFYREGELVEPNEEAEASEATQLKMPLRRYVARLRRELLANLDD